MLRVIRRVQFRTSRHTAKSCWRFSPRALSDNAHIQDQLHSRSLRDPKGFWGEAAKLVSWDEECDEVFDGTDTNYTWFPKGKLNVCYNAIDFHVKNGRGDQLAIIHDSPVTNSVTKFTYNEMLDQVSRCAGALAKAGVTKGDRVLIYMPMIPQAAITMMACARIGAIHGVVFGGFAPRELASRIADASPKVIVSASCGIEVKRIISYKPMLDEAIELAPEESRPSKCLIFQRPQQVATLVPGRDEDWEEAVSNASPHAPVSVESDHPLYILYTSGTTGKPKGVVRDSGGHSVMLKWTMRNVYDLRPGDTTFVASDIGWVVGHSYIVYGPLLQGCTTIMFEGKPVGTPDAGAFWRIISEYGVRSFFTAPTAFRALKGADPNGEFIKKYDISSLKTLFLAGERSDPDTLHWAEDHCKIPVIDHWWQTETGSPITARCRGLTDENEKRIPHLPTFYGSGGKAMPGYDIRVVDDNGKELPAGEGNVGELLVKQPLPPGCFYTLWNDPKGYQEKYMSKYPGFYETSDAGCRDEQNNFSIMSRIDDVINVAAHRLSTGEIEEILCSHPAIAESAVIGREDKLKGQVPLGFVVLKAGRTDTPEQIEKETIQLVRKELGPVASYKETLVVKRLPKTRSGKILRKQMRSIVDGHEYNTPGTIEDPDVLGEIEGSTKDLRMRLQQN